MPEPITLAVVGALVLTEGIKFLYGQASDLLKGWRARREAKKSAIAEAPPLPTLAGPPPDVLDGPVDSSLPADEELVEELESELEAAKKRLAKYTHPEDPEPVDPDDAEVRDEVDHLRRLLESIYGQRLTFVGEQGREPSGTVMNVQMRLSNIESSDIVGIEGAEQADAGSQLDVSLHAKDVKQSSVTGISHGTKNPAPRKGRDATPT